MTRMAIGAGFCGWLRWRGRCSRSGNGSQGGGEVMIDSLFPERMIPENPGSLSHRLRI
jgi:hypothetical protein